MASGCVFDTASRRSRTAHGRTILTLPMRVLTDYHSNGDARSLAPHARHDSCPEPMVPDRDSGVGRRSWLWANEGTTGRQFRLEDDDRVVQFTMGVEYEAGERTGVV